ncbi:MAG: DUF2169 domain-containing protein [Polyangiaceae bacterium]
MIVKNPSCLAHGTKATARVGKQPQMVVIVRAAFLLVPDGVATLVPGAFEGDLRAQGPLTADVLAPDDDERLGEVLYPSDLADFKLNAEVMLRGTCYAQKGRPIARSPVSFQVGDWQKTLQVTGHRAWSDRKVGAVMSDPIPFSSMPIGYGHAFGGEGYEPNPAGVGLTGDRVPNVEDPRDPIRSPGQRPAAPAGFGPLNPAWAPRCDKRGKDYGADYERTRAPFYSADFDWTHFHAAPADQQLAGYLRGDEAIVYTNLDPDHAVLRCRLPGMRVRVFYHRKGERIRELDLRIDTLFVDADERKAFLTWRGLADVAADDLHDVVSLLVVTEEAHEKHPAKRYHEELERFEADPLGLEERGMAELERERDQALAKLDDLVDKAEAIGTSGDEGLADEVGAMLEALDAPPHEVAEAKRGILELVAAKKEHRPGDEAITGSLTAAKESRKPAGPPPFVIPQPGETPPAPPQPGLVAAVRRALEEAEQVDARIDQAVTRPEVDLPEALQDRPRVADRLDPLREVVEGDLFKRLEGPPLVEPGPGRDLRRQDYRGWDLRGRDLRGADLREALLTAADLREAKLAGAQLDHAVLYEADLEGADLSDCSLTLTNFTKARARGLLLAGAAIDTTFFDEADLTGADLRRLRGTRGLFRQTDLSEANLSDADLFECIFDGVTLTKARFVKASLRSVAFMSATLERADFSDALLTRSSFSGGAASSACFVGARGERVVFMKTELERADFTCAILPDAFFNEAIARDARFFGADLRGANFYRSSLDRASFERANLFRADMRKSVLHDVSFAKASLFEASLLEAGGLRTDFTDANLTRCRTPS